MDAHEVGFLSSVATGAHCALSKLTCVFKFDGAPTLGSVVGNRRVRTCLKHITVDGIPLAAALRHVARAADALRHLTAGRIKATVEKLYAVTQHFNVWQEGMPALPAYDCLVQHIMSGSCRIPSCCAAEEDTERNGCCKYR